MKNDLKKRKLLGDWSQPDGPTDLREHILVTRSEFQRQKLLRWYSVVYGKKLAHKPGFLDAVAWAGYVLHPNSSSGEAQNVIAAANQCLRAGNHKFFSILAEIAKRRGVPKLKLDFYILENHFDWAGNQCTQLTINEMMDEITNRGDGKNSPEGVVVRRACHALGYKWRRAKRGRPVKWKS